MAFHVCVCMCVCVYVCVYSLISGVLQDIFHLETPGGGSFGQADRTKASADQQRGVKRQSAPLQTFIQRGSLYQYKLGQESA